MSRQAANLHATAVVLGGLGVAVTGESGAGKTTLGLALVAHWRASGAYAALVSDDQLFLSVCAGRVIVRAPDSIAGLAEARGLGPAPLRHEPAAVLDLVVQLVDPPAAPRLGEPLSFETQGVRVPMLRLPARRPLAGINAICAFAGVTPFAGSAHLPAAMPFRRGGDVE